MVFDECSRELPALASELSARCWELLLWISELGNDGETWQSACEADDGWEAGKLKRKGG